MFSCILHNYTRRLLKKGLVDKNVRNRLLSAAQKGNITQLFISREIQDVLKKLTRVDINKVYKKRKDETHLEPPIYKFLTTADLEKLKKEAEAKIFDKLQMPPVMEERQELDHVFLKDENLIGYSDSKYIFTDITYGSNDRERVVVVRDPDGTLRQARWEERDRMNEVYFPRQGRKLRLPKMFTSPHLQRLLESGEYEFVLDKACCQFEPDDPLYIRVCERTYSAVDSESAYNSLRSTRHYGPFVFHLARTDCIDNLLMENLATDCLDDAVSLVSLYYMIHPDRQTAPRENGKELEYIHGYIINNSSEKKAQLQLTFQTYKEYLSSPKSKEFQES